MMRLGEARHKHLAGSFFAGALTDNEVPTNNGFVSNRPSVNAMSDDPRNLAWPPEVELQTGLEPNRWIAPRLLPWEAVEGSPGTMVVPTRFPAYVRVLHPAGRPMEHLMPRGSPSQTLSRPGRSTSRPRPAREPVPS